MRAPPDTWERKWEQDRNGNRWTGQENSPTVKCPIQATITRAKTQKATTPTTTHAWILIMKTKRFINENLFHWTIYYRHFMHDNIATLIQWQCMETMCMDEIICLYNYCVNGHLIISLSSNNKYEMVSFFVCEYNAWRDKIRAQNWYARCIKTCVWYRHMIGHIRSMYWLRSRLNGAVDIRHTVSEHFRVNTFRKSSFGICYHLLSVNLIDMKSMHTQNAHR